VELDDGSVSRAVVSRALARRVAKLAEAHRRLAQQCGIENPLAIAAARAEREGLQNVFDEERSELVARHEQELRSARQSGAEQAMRRLAQSLLALQSPDGSDRPQAVQAAPLEASAVVQRGGGEAQQVGAREIGTAESALAAPTEPNVAEAVVPDLGVPELAEDSVSEAYVDSARCTSCNECTQKYPNVFAYNEDKQAELLDANAPFKALVAAAEMCPARCIHPGAPRSEDESVNDELIERAKAFA
jgi:ferredoxin